MIFCVAVCCCFRATFADLLVLHAAGSKNLNVQLELRGSYSPLHMGWEWVKAASLYRPDARSGPDSHEIHESLVVAMCLWLACPRIGATPSQDVADGPHHALCLLPDSGG